MHSVSARPQSPARDAVVPADPFAPDSGSLRGRVGHRGREEARWQCWVPGEMPRLYSCLAVTCLDFHSRARVRPRVGFHFSCVSHQTALLTLHSPHKQRCSHLLLRDPFTVGQGGVSSPCSPRTSAVTAGPRGFTAVSGMLSPPLAESLPPAQHCAPRGRQCGSPRSPVPAGALGRRQLSSKPADLP